MPNIRGCEQCELIAFLTNSLFPLESASADVPPLRADSCELRRRSSTSPEQCGGKKDDNICQILTFCGINLLWHLFETAQLSLNRLGWSFK